MKEGRCVWTLCVCVCVCGILRRDFGQTIGHTAIHSTPSVPGVLLAADFILECVCKRCVCAYICCCRSTHHGVHGDPRGRDQSHHRTEHVLCRGAVDDVPAAGHGCDWYATKKPASRLPLDQPVPRRQLAYRNAIPGRGLGEYLRERHPSHRHTSRSWTAPVRRIRLCANHPKDSPGAVHGPGQ